MEKRNRLQLLVVDDSEMNREILKEILGKEYRILEACDGEEALKILEQYGPEISLVLLDIIMPKMDGFEVLAYMNRDKCDQALCQAKASDPFGNRSDL